MDTKKTALQVEQFGPETPNYALLNAKAAVNSTSPKGVVVKAGKRKLKSHGQAPDAP